MKYSFPIIFIIFCLILLASAYAARIDGSCYDFTLQKMSDVVVTINTSPSQTYIAKEGDYSFNVPPGSYMLRANCDMGGSGHGLAEENITIVDDGQYHIDLIVIPVAEDERQILEELDNIELSEDTGLKNPPTRPLYLLFVLAIIIIAIYFLFRSRKRRKRRKVLKKYSPVEVKAKDYEGMVLEVIRKHDGRITQKELRKHIPLSEAKISLIVSDFESKGVIRKIKKGRGNILILQ